MDLTDYIDSFVEENYGEVSISDTAYHFFILGKTYAEEQMMSKAVKGTARPDDGEIWCDLKPFNFKDGDKVKVIVI